jgi:hypothetical protein
VGLNYSQVVQVLAALDEDEVIPGHLVLERESLTDLLGPAEVPERPEADEVEPVTEPPALEDVEEPNPPAGAGWEAEQP